MVVSMTRRGWLLVLLCVLLVAAGWLFADVLLRFGQGALFEVQRWQNAYRRSVAVLLADLRHAQDVRAWWALVGAGFVYGVLHAVGPGHGKAVIGTFLLTQPSGYRSALWLAVGSALLQGLSAVVWVGATFGLLQWLMRDALAQVVWAERLSHVLVMAAGGYLLWRARRGDGCCACGHGHDGHHHGHHHGHGGHHGEGRGAWLAALLAVGLRPCSGSLVALAVAGGWGMWGVGVAMTLAVSAGTALTVLALAVLTIFGRDQLAGRLLRGRFGWGKWLAMAGGVVLVVLGGVLLAGSMAVSPSPVFLPR